MNAPVRIQDLSIPRHDWRLDEVEALFARPFMELVFDAAAVHRRWFDPSAVQRSQLLSVKTGGCAENCGYCSQSAHFRTGLKAEKLMDPQVVIAEAMAAKAGGADRFCMGAAWRELKDRDLPKLAAMIGGVKALGLETCATLGMLTADQARQLKDAGLDPHKIHAERFGIGWVECVLGVDEGRRSPGLLTFRNGLQRERGLARGLRAVDLDDPSPRQAASAHRQVQPVEERDTREVLHRLPPRPARHEGREALGLPRGARGPGEHPGQQLAAPEAEHVGQQQLRVHAGRVHAGLGQQTRRPPQGLAPRLRLVRGAHASPPRAARRRSSSRARQEATTASRSPSSTASRLCALYPVRWSAIRFSGKL